MARPRAPKAPISVDSFQHDASRSNIPTADAAATFYDEEAGALEPLRYQRDPTLDPQLVWRGKDGQDGQDLFVDAPPIYIQEKIDSRALIENLRKTAQADQAEPELTMFDLFDELDGLDQVEYYQHEESWKNRMILGDSLQVMGSLAEREALRGKVQMIYIDPPYGIKFGSNWQARTSKRDVKDGNLNDAAREAEQIKAFRDTWELGIHSYLSYLRDRLVVARDLMTETGSVFVQIGDENVHLVRSLMDEVFGSSNWVATIVVTKTSSATGDFIGGTADYVHWYAKSRDRVKYRALLRDKSFGGAGSDMYTQVELADGSRRSLTREERSGEAALPPDGRLFRTGDLTSQGMGREKGEGAASWFPVEVDGTTYRPNAQARWKTNEAGMARLIAAGRIAAGKATLAYVRFLDDFPAFAYTEIWNDIGGARDKTYVVETSPTIIQRCLLMTTDPGDLVLDPTCGSGTAAFVAEQWGRRWITIDTSRVALALARQRLMGAKYPYYVLADTEQGRRLEGLPPAATRSDLRAGFVHEKVRHVTLKSIANNPDILDGMTRKQVDEAIDRYADYEVLYDKPKEDRSRVRVSGPFTVESLSPHRSLSFDEVEKLLPAGAERGETSFEQTILENLRTAGIQNGRREERIEFATLESFAGEYIQAVGEPTRGDAKVSERLAIAIGPQYGTVGPSFIKEAVKEAVKAEIGLIAVLAFAFDPQATGVTEADGLTVLADDQGFASLEGQRNLGRTQVLFVRMNVDLLMGADLKKSTTSNLFTVFGEPDIEVRKAGDKFVVELNGVDVYDPTSGDVRSSSTREIALWMVDTNYNEESFFVRHAYFTGEGDPLKNLKAALKAEIREEAWAALNRTVSLPFAAPTTRKIAVKVINDYGDEVMKVIEVAD